MPRGADLGPPVEPRPVDARAFDVLLGATLAAGRPDAVLPPPFDSAFAAGRDTERASPLAPAAATPFAARFGAPESGRGAALFDADFLADFDTAVPAGRGVRFEALVPATLPPALFAALPFAPPVGAVFGTLRDPPAPPPRAPDDPPPVRPGGEARLPAIARDPSATGD
ncbi:MAG: hypothetical protein ACR2NO_06745 [Chloroflexota bacterium]